jgi:hypothetical protein
MHDPIVQIIVSALLVLGTIGAVITIYVGCHKAQARKMGVNIRDNEDSDGGTDVRRMPSENVE